MSIHTKRLVHTPDLSASDTGYFTDQSNLQGDYKLRDMLQHSLTNRSRGGCRATSASKRSLPQTGVIVDQPESKIPRSASAPSFAMTAAPGRTSLPRVPPSLFVVWLLSVLSPLPWTHWDWLVNAIAKQSYSAQPSQAELLAIHRGSHRDGSHQPGDEPTACCGCNQVGD